MFQPCVLSRSDLQASPRSAEETTSDLALETADLRRQLAAQTKLIAAVERRVGRSLGSIQTHLGQFDSSEEPQVLQPSLDSMAAELHQLSDLLADATLLQKLEAGKVPIHLEQVNPHLVLDSVSRHLLASKDGGAPRLVCKISSDLPCIHADQEQTEAVLMDLLGRALKYSDPASLIVLSADNSGSQVAIDITAQRFAPIGQEDFAPEIALCCKRVELQNGKVACQTQLNGFTIVTLILQAVR